MKLLYYDKFLSFIGTIWHMLYTAWMCKHKYWFRTFLSCFIFIQTQPVGVVLYSPIVTDADTGTNRLITFQLVSPVSLRRCLYTNVPIVGYEALTTENETLIILWFDIAHAFRLMVPLWWTSWLEWSPWPGCWTMTLLDHIPSTFVLRYTRPLCMCWYYYFKAMHLPTSSPGFLDLSTWGSLTTRL